MRIEGEIGDIKENKIYLGEITNTYYGLFDPIDSAEIEEGKFTFTVDRVKKQMLFLGFRPGQGGMVFAEAGNLKVKPATVKKGGVVWEVSGSALNDKYRDFLKAWCRCQKRSVAGFVGCLVFAARDREDREEMARIKEESMPYYEQAQMAEDQLVRQTVDGNMENPSEFICTTVNYSDGKISLLKKISVRKGNTRKILDRKLSRLLISL